MNQQFTDFHRKALCEVMELVGDSFTYNNCVYTGIISAQELSAELMEGGLLEVFTTQIIVSKAQLATAPVTGQTLFIGTQKARIIRVAEDEVSWELNCVTATK